MEILPDAIDGRHRSVLQGPTGLRRYRTLHVFLLKKKRNKTRTQTSLRNIRQSHSPTILLSVPPSSGLCCSPRDLFLWVSSNRSDSLQMLFGNQETTSNVILPSQGYVMLLSNPRVGSLNFLEGACTVNTTPETAFWLFLNEFHSPINYHTRVNWALL